MSSIKYLLKEFNDINKAKLKFVNETIDELRNSDLMVPIGIGKFAMDERLIKVFKQYQIPLLEENAFTYIEYMVFYEEYIKSLEKVIFTTDSMIRAFDKTKCIGKINDFSLLIVCLSLGYMANKIELEKVINILGSAIKFNYTKYSKDNLLLKALSNYFDNNGNFVKYGNGLELVELLKKLYKENIDENSMDKKVDVIFNSLIINIGVNYDEFLENAKEEVVEDKKKIKREKVEVEEHLPEEETRKKYPFLSKEEKEIYEYCSNNIESISYRSDYQYYLEACKDIQSLDLLYQDLENSEVLEIKNEVMEKLYSLVRLIGPLHYNRENEIVFLKNSKSSFYVSDDILKIDKGLRKKINTLFDKLLNNVNTRTVLNNNIKRGELLFVNDSNLVLTYCKLCSDTSLVIGIHPVKEGMNEDINRYLLNKKYIESLKVLVKDDNSREELVSSSRLLVKTRD